MTSIMRVAHLGLQHLYEALLVAGLHAAEDRHGLQGAQLLLRRQLIELHACVSCLTAVTQLFFCLDREFNGSVSTDITVRQGSTNET